MFDRAKHLLSHVFLHSKKIQTSYSKTLYIEEAFAYWFDMTSHGSKQELARIKAHMRRSEDLAFEGLDLQMGYGAVDGNFS